MTRDRHHAQNLPIDGSSRLLSNGAALTVDGAGRFGFAVESEPSKSGPQQRLAHMAGTYLDERRRTAPKELDYLILVPTLRCNLACTYCQVSRAAEAAQGYDWDERTVDAVLQLVSNLSADAIKIEFQGGEPTLRPDLINRVMHAVPERVEASFVVCSNLEALSDEILDVFDRDDLSISTSLDGPRELHTRQRGQSNSINSFADNLRLVLDRYGPNKISALPTIDPLATPKPYELVEAFAEFGLTSIYLRPINYQGFARKNHAESRAIGKAWTAYQRRFIEFLIERNWRSDLPMEETYFSMLLRRIFRPGSNRHVDLRNPNPIGRDYIVIDYDGTAYPTDEARMLARAGVIDLSIGDVHNGWDTPARAALDAASSLDQDPQCKRCAYKPFCGRDIVDDISRYGTIDLPRHETEFCQRHMALFDFAFDLIHSCDEKVQHSLGHWLDLPGPLPRMRQIQ